MLLSACGANAPRAAASTSEIRHAPERAGDVRHSRASANKLRAAGWIPRHTLDEGLAKTMEFFRRR